MSDERPSSDQLPGVGLSTACNLSGMKIVSHPLAREVRDEFRVERHPINKRRRNWRVVKHHIDRPCAWIAGDVIYMHPELAVKLPRGV